MTIVKATQDQEREQYEYRYDALQDISPELRYPMASKIMFADQSFTKWKWTQTLISIVLRILSNQAMQDVAVRRGSARRLITYVRLSRILESPKHLSFIERIFYSLLPLVRFVLNLVGRRPKSQNIEHDVKEEQHPDRVAARVESMVADLQQARPVRPLSTYPAEQRSFEDYRDLFQIIYLPNISDHFLEDRTFAAQRVAGANPLVLEQVSEIPPHFPVTDQQYQAAMGEDDSLQTALDEGRVYLADYQILEALDPGTVKIDDSTETLQKYNYAPLALFAIAPGTCPSRILMPVAIQCNPEKGSPIFIPPSLTATAEERWAWRMAKTIVQIADGNYHELISHLGRTHLWIEPIAVGTYRCLGAQHPLGKLLLPHFEGTFFINNAAAVSLIAPGGGVDQLLSGTLLSSVKLSVKGAKGYPFAFNDSMLPQTFTARGVADSQKLPDYPYRDDALLIWDAIHDWVEAYLKIYYQDDAAVLKDQILQSWLAELMAENGGQMEHIGETTDDSTPKVRTLNYLIDATTLIIFTCSAQHAAVNFPQESLMNFAPNMPLAGYTPAPMTTQVSEADYFALLPTLNQAETQMDLLYTLGSVYYTQLGQYKANEVDLEEASGTDYFTDEQIAQPLQDFQQRLQKIELIMQERNEIRPTFYDTLLPSKIPQSTNI